MKKNLTQRRKDPKKKTLAALREENIWNLKSIW